MIKYSHYAPHRTRLFKGEGCLRRGVFTGFHLTRGDNGGVIWMNSCGFECSANSFGIECLEKGGPEDREEILLVHRMQGALFEGIDCIVPLFLHLRKADHIESLEGVRTVRRIHETHNIVVYAVLDKLKGEV